MYARLALAVLLVSASSLLACGDDGGSSDASVDAEIDAPPTPDAATDVAPDASTEPAARFRADYCEPLAAWLCEGAASCGCGVADEAECAAAFTERCAARIDPLLDDLSSGILSVSDAAIARCLEATFSRTAPCEPPNDGALVSACVTIIAGTESLGASCAFPLCAGGEGLCVDDVCAPLPVEGAPCEGLCADPGVCVEGACRAPPVSGEACGGANRCLGPARCVAGVCRVPAALGESCDHAEACVSGLLCEGGSCVAAPSACMDASVCGPTAECLVPAARACVATLDVGAPCTSDRACGGGTYCDDTTNVCAAPPGDGAACGNGAVCGAGLGCGFPDGPCAPLPVAAQPCALGLMGPSLCADGLGCVAGMCATMPGDGDICTVDNRCAGELGCDFRVDGSFCAARRDAGAECMNDQICGAGTFCDFGELRCTTWLAAGAPCSDGNECGDASACVPNDAGAFACALLPALGAGCFDACVAGAFCSTSGEGQCLPAICQL